jgi:hypothetical protein
VQGYWRRRGEANDIAKRLQKPPHPRLHPSEDSSSWPLAPEQERVHCTPTVSGRLRLRTSDASPRRDPEAQDITAADAAEGDGGRNSFLPATPPALLVDTHSPSKVRPRTLPKRSRIFPRRSWPTSGTGERGDALCTSPETVGGGYQTCRKFSASTSRSSVSQTIARSIDRHGIHRFEWSEAEDHPNRFIRATQPRAQR